MSLHQLHEDTRYRQTGPTISREGWCWIGQAALIAVLTFGILLVSLLWAGWFG